MVNSEYLSEYLSRMVCGYVSTLRLVADNHYYDDEPEIREDYGGDDKTAYFESVDVCTFRIDRRGTWHGAKMYLAYGSPVVTFDTESGEIHGWLGDAEEIAYVDSDTRIALDDYFESEWEIMRCSY